MSKGPLEGKAPFQGPPLIRRAGRNERGGRGGADEEGAGGGGREADEAAWGQAAEADQHEAAGHGTAEGVGEGHAVNAMVCHGLSLIHI